jgi:hypothetical protein
MNGMLGLTLALAAQTLSGVQPTADSYVGRWNLLITDATDTFVSGGLQIEEKDGALQAGLVWRAGSYLPVKSVEVKGGVLHIAREGRPGQLDRFEATLEKDLLKGEATLAGGTVRHFEGRRAPALDRKGTPTWGTPVRLFNGKDLVGWKLRDPKKQNGWAASNGELVVVEPRENADLVTERTFQDFKLHIEFNVDAKSNSGVYLRGRYEIQILDNAGVPEPSDIFRCAALYTRLAPKLDATKPPGEWQTFEIVFFGRHVEVTLNGSEVVNGTAEGITGGALSPWEGDPGPLMLQGDHGKVRFRNIVVTPAN